MSLSSIDHGSSATDLRSLFARVPDPMIDRQSDFLNSLGIEGRKIDARETRASDEDTALKAAQDFVATTFIQPILKQAREMDNAPPPFGRTDAEKQLASLADGRLALDIVRASNFPLVERLARDMRNEPMEAPALNGAPDRRPIDDNADAS